MHATGELEDIMIRAHLKTLLQQLGSIEEHGYSLLLLVLHLVSEVKICSP